jgi:hypothetical protein
LFVGSLICLVEPLFFDSVFFFLTFGFNLITWLRPFIPKTQVRVASLCFQSEDLEAVQKKDGKIGKKERE